MDKHRLSYKNQLYIEKKNIENSIKRLNETIHNIRLQNFSNDFITNKVEQTKLNIKSSQENLDKIIQKIKDVDKGLYDQYLKDRIYNDKKEIDKKSEDKQKQKDLRKKEKEILKLKTNTYWDNIKKSNFENNRLKRNYSYNYKEYIKAVNTIPEYMKNNLKTMTNNKGYIWRGCHFYGSLPYEKGKPDVIFEKKKGNILRIYEIFPNEKKIYEKKGKNKKKLISSFIRIKK